MRIQITILCFIAASAEGAAAENSITFYRDGTLVQQEFRAVKGVVTVPLAAGLLDHSLSVIPAPGTRILSVDTFAANTGTVLEKDLDSLTEQRRRLEDRLQALETREAIFTAAAKAQSGKAPRKTKSNPDPLQAIRQGTDFAIAQLEAVYTARRKTNQEIQKIDTRRAAAGKNRRQPAVESSARISVTPPNGRVTLRYATSERAWQPIYNLHLTGGGPAELHLSAQITADGGRGGLQFVSTETVADSHNTQTFPVRSGSALLATYHLPITEEHFTAGIFNQFSGTIMNSSAYYLPPGESGLFRNGVYLGKFRFEGLSSGRSRGVSLGR
jgi:hypothetical protein